jgi:arylsulfatase A-like enzyme
MDAATDQYAPELVRDNSSIDAPGTFASGYHLTADLVDQSIRFLAGHAAEQPDAPWLLWLAPAACHAPHQGPVELIKSYDAVFKDGWDAERLRRMERQKAMGIVPASTRLPPRNDGVQPWASHSADERRCFTRLQSAYAAMLDHADQHLARLVGFLEQTGMLENTLVLVLSDNGASQEGGPVGFFNSAGPRNSRDEPFAEKLAHIDDIGGPNSHTYIPHGWAMASNTPLRRYKQNTHGGGIRDPLVICWPRGITARGELRHQFAHACDLTPTLLDLLGIDAPAEINGVRQMPIEGTSFAASLNDPTAPSKASPQYFEMFGHRGLWHAGWKAVAYHPPDTPYENGIWELFHLDEDFSETSDLAAKQPERLAALVRLWWQAAERHNVLPLDDRFRQRFVVNARRFHGARKRYVFHAGNGAPAGRIESRLGFVNFISWTGLDIGRDRGSPVSYYKAPFEFTGTLIKVTVTMDDDQMLDGDGIGRAQMARE